MNEELIKIKNARDIPTTARNSMGCSENWYNAYFAIANTFDDETLDKMSDEEIDHLIKLADTIGEALY